MNYQELMEQANAHTIAVSEAMRNVELAKAVFDEATDSSMSVALLTDGNGITSIADIIGDDMLELKALATGFVKIAYESRVNELEKLMGIKKAAIPNPGFEKAVLTMEHGQTVQNTTEDVNSDDSTSETEKQDKLHVEEENGLKIENTTLKSDSIVLSKPDQETQDKKPELDCSRDNLYKLYITNDMSVKEIMADYNITSSALYKVLGKYGLVDLKKTKRQDAKYCRP